MLEPIYVHCEGSGGEGHEIICPSGYLMCEACGQMALADNGRVPTHDRKDLIAMIARGDFDE